MTTELGRRVDEILDAVEPLAGGGREDELGAELARWRALDPAAAAEAEALLGHLRAGDGPDLGKAFDAAWALLDDDHPAAPRRPRGSPSTASSGRAGSRPSTWPASTTRRGTWRSNTSTR